MLPKNDKYDVVIVGAGLAGQSAAAQAGERGLKALVVEQGRTTDGSGNYVEGVFAVGTEMQKKAGIDLTKEQILHDEQEFSHYEADTLIWKDYIDYSAENVNWLQSLGVKFKGVATLGSGLNTWHMFDGLGRHAIHNGLEPYAKEHGVEYITSASVEQLEKDNRDEINSLIVKDFETKENKTIFTKAVVLATGGYLNNRSMLSKYFNSNSNRIVPMNSGKSTGSGLNLAWNVGAKKFGLGMAMMFGGQIKEDKVPSYKYWKTDIGIATCEMAPLWVNEIGERFVDESSFRIWSYAGNAIIRQEKVYAILDQGIIDKFNDVGLPRSLKPLSERTKLDKLKNMIKSAQGQNLLFVTQADSVVALAKKLKLPNLSATIERYNDEAEKKQDLDFEKSSNYLIPVQKGPYYAFELGVGAYCTMGGLRVNRANEVLDDNGHKVPGLYAVGSDASGVLVGDTYGVNVPGSEVGYCIYSGRNAINHIVK